MRQHIIIIGLLVISCFSPAVTLTATSNNQPLSFTDVISQSNGSQFSITCHGSGNIIWTSSNEVFIPTNQSGIFYQIVDSIGEQVSLVFTSFSHYEVAVYTCAKDVNGVPITKSVLVTNCKLGSKSNFDC